MDQCSACKAAAVGEWEYEHPGWNLCKQCLFEMAEGKLSPEKVLRLRKTRLGGFYFLQHVFYDRDGRRTNTPLPK